MLRSCPGGDENPSIAPKSAKNVFPLSFYTNEKAKTLPRHAMQYTAAIDDSRIVDRQTRELYQGAVTVKFTTYSCQKLPRKLWNYEFYNLFTLLYVLTLL